MRWRRPHLIPIDPQALVTGNNTITIDSAYGGGTHVLAGVLIGPADELAWRYQRQFFLAHTVTWIGATMAAAIALLFTVLWLRRRESLLALVSVAALLWVGRSSFFLIETMPTEALPWLRLLYYGCSGGFTAFMAIALLRLSGRRGMREAWGIVGYALVGPALVLLAAPYVTPFIDLLWTPGLIAIAALAWGYATYNRLRNREAPHGPLLAAVLVTLIAAAHDYALWSGWVSDASQLALHWAGPILLVALSLPMVDRFVDALRDAEVARAQLESRVKEREQLLKRNFERLRATERLQVQAQERQRIMQDMHDGLGTQLLSSLMLVERGALNQQQLAQVLRESIDDMRLAIDALALDDGGLLSALGNFRYRMEPRMRAAGVELQWDAKGLPEEIDVHPDMVLPILRIVQEALTNALKHSGARAVRGLADDGAGRRGGLARRARDRQRPRHQRRRRRRPRPHEHAQPGATYRCTVQDRDGAGYRHHGGASISRDGTPRPATRAADAAQPQYRSGHRARSRSVDLRSPFGASLPPTWGERVLIAAICNAAHEFSQPSRTGCGPMRSTHSSMVIEAS